MSISNEITSYTRGNVAEVRRYDSMNGRCMSMIINVKRARSHATKGAATSSRGSMDLALNAVLESPRRPSMPARFVFARESRQ